MTNLHRMPRSRSRAISNCSFVSGFADEILEVIQKGTPAQEGLGPRSSLRQQCLTARHRGYFPSVCEHTLLDFALVTLNQNEMMAVCIGISISAGPGVSEAIQLHQEHIREPLPH